MLQVDRRIVKGREISVALSRPPSKTSAETAAEFTPVAPSAATKAAFRPRAALKHEKPRLQLAAAPPASATGTAAQPAAEPAAPARMTNSMFAALFKK